MQFNTLRVLDLSHEIEASLDELTKHFLRFRGKTQDYSRVISDNIADSATALCEEIDLTLKEARALLDKMNDDLNEGANIIKDAEASGEKGIRGI